MTAAATEVAEPGTTPGLVDLASRRLGGLVVAANDEFFGAADHLLAPAPPAFDPLAYTGRGKLVDGWETRRRRSEGHDWCVVRLGVPGVVHELVVDTSHFTGNYPQSVAVHGTVSEDTVPDDDDWFELLATHRIRGNAVQGFRVPNDRRVTHVRLSIHPDGGVARLRVLGRPTVDLHRVADPGGRLDLAAVVNGGCVPACSDEFFADATNLVMVGDGRDMSDGWETRRRRGPGRDWVVVELATTGIIERVELDTTNFLGNHPDTCVLDAAHAPAVQARHLVEDDWTPIAPPVRMRPHARHVVAVTDQLPATHLRLSLQPDGGVARLRAFGVVTDEGWRRAGVHLLDSLRDPEAAAVFRSCCGAEAWVDEMVTRRPFGEPGPLFTAADEAWAGMGDDDVREALAAHPRIGERSSSAQSRREQSAAADADDDVRIRLRDGNVAYEERFGHVFLIRAAGRSAEEMLAALDERLGNDPATELEVAAEQQHEITRLRLGTWLREGDLA